MLLCALTLGSATLLPAQQPPVRLHTLEEMNATPEPLDSHAGEER